MHKSDWVFMSGCLPILLGLPNGGSTLFVTAIAGTTICIAGTVLEEKRV
jgi:hypothetical protein